MRRRTAILLLLTPALLPAIAHATVGGPSSMTVLGFAPVDRKVFVREERSEGEVALYYIPLDGPRSGVLVPMRPRDPDEDQAERASRLEQRLVPLSAVAPAEFSLRRERVHRIRHTVYADIVWNGWRTRITVDHRDAAASATAELDVYPTREARPPHIVHAARVPGLPWAAVTVRYLGDPHESGYTIEHVLLVPLAG